MKVPFSYPVVLYGTPKRSRLPKTIACLIPADVEIREYGADDAIPAFSIRDHYQKDSDVVRLNGQLFKRLAAPFPLKTAALDEIGTFLGHHMMTGGQPFMTARTRFGQAFEARKIDQAWPASANEGRSQPLQTFTVPFLHSLPKLEDVGAADISQVELDQRHREAQRVADNIVAIDGQLFTRCNEPYAAFIDWNHDLAFGYEDDSLGREHLDGRDFDPALDCRYQSFWYFQAALSDRYVFPASMKAEAIAFAEDVTKSRRRKSAILEFGGDITVHGEVMSLQDAIDFDTARFARQAVVTAWVIGRRLFDRKVRGTLVSDIERVVSEGEHLAMVVKAGVPAGLLQEAYYDVVEACQALSDQLDGEANQIIKTICTVSKLHKRRL
jgi:hypothetical protein